MIPSGRNIESKRFGKWTARHKICAMMHVELGINSRDEQGSVFYKGSAMSWALECRVYPHPGKPTFREDPSYELIVQLLNKEGFSALT